MTKTNSINYILKLFQKNQGKILPSLFAVIGTIILGFSIVGLIKFFSATVQSSVLPQFNAGFFHGIYHGLVLPFTIKAHFLDNIPAIAVTNSGAFYYLGVGLGNIVSSYLLFKGTRSAAKYLNKKEGETLSLALKKILAVYLWGIGVIFLSLMVLFYTFLMVPLFFYCIPFLLSLVE